MSDKSILAKLDFIVEMCENIEEKILSIMHDLA
jgi:hypothetical protein